MHISKAQIINCRGTRCRVLMSAGLSNQLCRVRVVGLGRLLAHMWGWREDSDSLNHDITIERRYSLSRHDAFYGLQHSGDVWEGGSMLSCVRRMNTFVCFSHARVPVEHQRRITLFAGYIYIL